MSAFVADFQHQNGVCAHVARCLAQQAAHKVHAIDATCRVAIERHGGFSPEFGRQLGHAAGIDIRWVAQNQVVRPAMRRKTITLVQVDALVQAVALHIDFGHFKRLSTDVRRLHHHIRVNQRGQHRQTAVTGAQVEHPVGRFAEPVVQAALDQHLSNQRARHDGALIDIKRHALQPRLMRQVGSWLAGGDTRLDECRYCGLLGGRDQPFRRRNLSLVIGLQRRIQRQAELPQHQPGGFVKGILGAMAKDDASLHQPLGGLGDAFQQGDVTVLGLTLFHASNCACRFSSVRR